MVSRQETARPLLTPGEVMQLSPNEAIVMVSGVHPVRAGKVRYYEDAQLQEPGLKPSRSQPVSLAAQRGRLVRTRQFRLPSNSLAAR